MELVAGQILAGKYRIERVLGRGGMGLVVAATHLQLGERVALKFLLPAALEDAPTVARFEREARAAARIKSEHVARVTDVGKLDNGAPYLVMEYLEGIDLAAWLRQRGPLPIEQAVEFVLQACEAMAEAHTLDIVHRDLKPANLFVIQRPDGALAVKVLDFGISKSTGAGGVGDPRMTRTSATLGSPLYMSPEQMQSAKDVDSRGDIWALGVVLYELLSGGTPFTAETLTSLVLQVVNSPPLPLRAARPDVPAALEAVVLKCLEKDRAARYQSVAELARALSTFGSPSSKPLAERIGRVMARAGSFAAATQVEVLSAPPSAPPQLPHTLASWGQTGATPSHRWRLALIVGGLLGVALVVVAVLRAQRRGPELAVSAASLEPSTRLPSSEPTAVRVTPLESMNVPAVDPSSALPSVPAAVSVATSAEPAPTRAPAIGRVPRHGGASHATTATVASEPTPAPKPVRAALAPLPSSAPASKNPLKMPIQ